MSPTEANELFSHLCSLFDVTPPTNPPTLRVAECSFMLRNPDLVLETMIKIGEVLTRPGVSFPVKNWSDAMRLFDRYYCKMSDVLAKTSQTGNRAQIEKQNVSTIRISLSQTGSRDEMPALFLYMELRHLKLIKSPITIKEFTRFVKPVTEWINNRTEVPTREAADFVNNLLEEYAQEVDTEKTSFYPFL